MVADVARPIATLPLLTAAERPRMIFDWNATDLEPPGLPDPTAVASAPCALGGDTNRDLPEELIADHQQDLENLEDLALAGGFEIGSGSVDQIFRAPDSIKQAAADGDCEVEPSPPPPVPIGTPKPKKHKRKRRRKKRRKRSGKRN